MRQRTDAVDIGINGERRLVLTARDARSDPARRGLLFDLRTSIGYLLRLGSWEGGLVVERVVGRDVKVIDEDPRLEFLNELGAAGTTSPMRVWAQPIPERLVDFVRQLYVGQLAVLQTVRHAPAAIDLLDGAQHLLWLVATTAAERATPWEHLAQVLGGRRRSVLEWCGGKGTDAAVKALEKADAMRFTPAGLRVLRAVAAAGARRDPRRERLERDYPELLDFPFYRQFVKKLGNTLLRESEGRDLDRLLRDVRALAAALEVPHIESHLEKLQQIGALRALHDELVERLLELPAPVRETELGKLPPPPLRGTDDIVPISTAVEFDGEGRVMRHCCAAYESLVRARTCAIYRVLRPERATLELDLTRGQPRLAQLRGAGNAPVSQETWDAVISWHRSALVEWKAKQARREQKRRDRGEAR